MVPERRAGTWKTRNVDSNQPAIIGVNWTHKHGMVAAISDHAMVMETSKVSGTLAEWRWLDDPQPNEPRFIGRLPPSKGALGVQEDDLDPTTSAMGSGPVANFRGCQGGICLLLLLTMAALLGGCMQGSRTNPPLGPRPTSSPNSGPGVAPDGETPAEAATRLFPEMYAQALQESEPREFLRGAEPGAPVPVSEVYFWPADLVRWVLPDDRKAIAAGSLFSAMWPNAMSRNEFLVPMTKDGISVCEFWAGLSEGHWIGGSLNKGRLPTGEVHRLDVASVQLRAMLGRNTEVRPVIFLPSGIAFAVGDNAGREAAVPLGVLDYGPGISDPGTLHSIDIDESRVYSLAELSQLLMSRYE